MKITTLLPQRLPTLLTTFLLFSVVAHAREDYILTMTAPDTQTQLGNHVFTCISQQHISNTGMCIPTQTVNLDLGNGWWVHLYHNIQINNDGTWRTMSFSNYVWTAAAKNGVGINKLRAGLQLTYTSIGTDKPTKPLWWCATTAGSTSHPGWQCKKIMGQGLDIPDPVIPASCAVMNDTTIDLGTITIGEPIAKEKKVAATLNCNMDTTMKIEYKCDDPTSEYCIIKSMPGVTHTITVSGSQISTGAAKNGEKISMATGNNHLVLTDTYTGTPTVSGVYRGSGLIQTTYE